MQHRVLSPTYYLLSGMSAKTAKIGQKGNTMAYHGKHVRTWSIQEFATKHIEVIIAALYNISILMVIIWAMASNQ